MNSTHERNDRPAPARRRFRPAPRILIAMAVLAVAAPQVAHSQAPGQPGQAAPPPPEEPAQPVKKMPAPAKPVMWWCEVNALPAADSTLTPDEAGRNFFVSQVITRPHTVDPDEQHQVTRICRTAFEVQFGGLWRLVTARAQQAPSVEAARLARLQDLRVGNHEGHERTFRIPDWHG